MKIILQYLHESNHIQLKTIYILIAIVMVTYKKIVTPS